MHRAVEPALLRRQRGWWRWTWRERKTTADLNTAIRETGAEKVFVTHGYTEIFAHWLTSQGIEAHEVKTKFEGELGEMAEGVPVGEEAEG